VKEKSLFALIVLGLLAAEMTAVCLVLFPLKLAGVIDWSWWGVTAPLWIPVIIFICLGVLPLLYSRLSERGPDEPGGL